MAAEHVGSGKRVGEQASSVGGRAAARTDNRRRHSLGFQMFESVPPGYLNTPAWSALAAAIPAVSFRSLLSVIPTSADKASVGWWRGWDGRAGFEQPERYKPERTSFQGTEGGRCAAGVSAQRIKVTHRIRHCSQTGKG